MVAWLSDKNFAFHSADPDLNTENFEQCISYEYGFSQVCIQMS